tara:strand:+ start:11263 stop:12327 length:1065 start_codon:yes stop_codon:yes gene_type:complete
MKNRISPNKILLVARTWSNRGNNTDFKHFFNFFPNSINITNKETYNWDNAIYRFIRKKVNSDAYSSLSIRIELEVIKQVIIHRPKIVHYWFADHDYLFLSYLKKIFGFKLVGNFFFSNQEFEKRMPNKQHLTKLDLVTASGQSQREYLSNFVSKEKIAYLPLGIDTNFFVPNNLKIKNLNSEKILLHVGTNRRDFSSLKKVFIKLKKLIPDLKLELVGGNIAKDIFSEIDGVKFYNFLSDKSLLKVYHKATVLILPLLEGGSSQSLNEALATGLPVVTNHLPNLIDYIVEDAVLLSPVGDVDMMVENCYSLFSDHAKLENASIKARKHSLKYDFKKIRNRIIDLYDSKLGYKII